MFDILDEARLSAMQKQIKISNIRFNSIALLRMGTHGCGLPDR